MTESGCRRVFQGLRLLRGAMMQEEQSAPLSCSVRKNCVITARGSRHSHHVTYHLVLKSRTFLVVHHDILSFCNQFRPLSAELPKYNVLKTTDTFACIYLNI